ncbi:glycoside hydrolase [Streptomyces sp. AJS327]|nr:glycoside hydrolase [Streptomyces sp. AJS327]
MAALGGVGAGAAETDQKGAGGLVDTGTPVPGWIHPLVEKAAENACPQVTASLLAAQLYAESGFDPKAVSSAGARGIAQFMPDTWRSLDPKGERNIMAPRDVIPIQAKYDCQVARQVKDVPGDLVENMLAAYNAGPAAVLKYRGIPPYPETRAYVTKIRRLAEKWAAPLRPTAGSASPAAQRAVRAAKSALGSWYRWGGTCVRPFQGNQACDCSSLMKMAWRAGGVNLPRTTYEQVRVGKPVREVSRLRPGDLLFTRGSAKRPEHVAMYLGGGQVIDAPRTGLRIRIRPVDEWAPRVLAIRHIA